MTIEPSRASEPAEPARLDRVRQSATDELLKAVGEGRLSFDAYCELADDIRGAPSTAVIEQKLTGVRRAAPAPDAARRTSMLFSLLGDVRRTGAWHVASDTNVVCLMGEATLDLREAYLQPGDVTITCWGLFGDLKIVVPDGVDVRHEGFTLFGDIDTDVYGESIPNAPEVTVRYYSLFGDSRVASESSTAKWLARLTRKIDKRRRRELG